MSVIAVLVGASLVLLRKRFAQYTIRLQNRVWGFQFGENARRSAEVVTLIVGVGFVTMGILATLGIIRPK